MIRKIAPITPFRGKQRKKGQAVVELALMLPLILLLIFGITEFGRAWMTVNVMYTATREGARLAVVTAPDVPRVEGRVTEICSTAGITPTSIQITGPDVGDPLRRVTVTVTADFDVIPGRILGTFEGSIPISATTTMRHESF